MWISFVFEVLTKTSSRLGTELAVWQDDEGLIWDATLVKVGATKTQVNIMRIQLLVHRGSNSFHAWHSPFQSGSSGNEQLPVREGSLDSAKLSFEKKFRKYSGLEWTDRHALSLSKWICLERIHREDPILTSKTNMLPPSVEKVLKFIFESANLDNYVQALTQHGRHVMTHTMLEKEKLLIGIAILSKLMKLISSPETSDNKDKARDRLVQTYKRVSLASSGVATNASLATENEVRQELESLDLLLRLKNASEIMEKKPSPSSLALSQISHVLSLAEMVPGINIRAFLLF